MYATAVAALACGLSVVPPAQDGSKRPDADSWAPFQEAPPTIDQLDKWYEGAGRTGVGIVTGKVSGGLEMLEFEGRARHLLPELEELCRAAGLGDLLRVIVNGYCETTPSGGVHLLTLTDEPKTERLAVNEAGQVLIETKGEGGYCIVSPTFGAVHPTGKPWTLTHGGFESIVSVSAEERHELHKLCRTLGHTRSVSPIGTVTPAAASNGLRPGDDFNRRGNWPAILEPYGWTAPLHGPRRKRTLAAARQGPRNVGDHQ